MGKGKRSRSNRNAHGGSAASRSRNGDDDDGDDAAAAPSPVQGKHADQEKLTTFLGKMLYYHMNGDGPVTFVRLGKELRFHERNNAWRAVWKHAKQEGLIEEQNGDEASGWVISEHGLDLARTPEYEEFLKDQTFEAQTSDEHQAHLKKKLDSTGVKIFDLLMRHGSVAKVELAGLLNVKPGSHKFFYAEKDLRKRGYVEIDPTDKKRRRLADAAFMRPEDRPDAGGFEAGVLEKAVLYATTKNKDGNVPREPKVRPVTEKKGQRKAGTRAYANFVNRNRAEVKGDFPDLSFGGVTKKLGGMWRALSDEEKLEYQGAKGGDGELSELDGEAGSPRVKSDAAVGDDAIGEPGPLDLIESEEHVTSENEDGEEVADLPPEDLGSTSTDINHDDIKDAKPVEDGDQGTDGTALEPKELYKVMDGSSDDSDFEPGLTHEK